MSITLDATLKTAQDGISHRPIVKVTSSPAESAIPYRGNNFNAESYIEENRDLIVTSTGRLANLYVRGEDLYYYYSNTDRNEWATPVQIANIEDEILLASICELTNNNLGIIIVAKVGTEDYDLKYMIISQTGTVVTSPTDIETGLSWLGAPSVITLANDTYLLVYPQGTGEVPDITKDYYLYKRTSSNFTSWGSASAVTLTGLDLNYYKNNPHLLQITSGRIFLHFDYLTDYQNEIEINNIYYITSDNNGSSWSTPVAITSYDTVSSMGIRPVATEQSGGNITVAYQEQNAAMYFNENLDGWPENKNFSGNALQYDEATKTLVHGCLKHGDLSLFDNICQIDCNDNTYVTYWDEDTSPATLPIPNSMRKSRHPYYLFSDNHRIMVLNVETNTWIIYSLACAHGAWYAPEDANVITGHCGTYGWQSFGQTQAYVRTVNGQDRLYIAQASGSPGMTMFGYIDLSEVADPITGDYTWHEVRFSTGYQDGWTGTHIPFGGELKNFFWIPEINKFCLISYGTGIGGLRYADFGIALFYEDGTIYKSYVNNNQAGFPTAGVLEAIYMNESLWFLFSYDEAEHPDRRGLGRIKLSDDTITYHEANWFSCSQNCGFRDLTDMGDDNRILLTCNIEGCDKGGVVIFNTSTFEWTVFNNTTVPGLLIKDGNPQCTMTCQGWQQLNVGLGYDSVTKTIFASYWEGYTGCVGTSHGVIAFSEYGSFSTFKHATIINPDGTPIYGSFTDLLYYDFEHNLAMVTDEDGYLWLTWNHMDSLTETDLMWANSMEDKELQSYFDINSDLKIEWDVQKISKLSFNLSHGYLFDPLNYSSIWSVYLKMGRILILQIGEEISETDYYQDQGKFTVKETSLKYGKDYPKIQVKAEDMRTLWEDNRIIASEYFSNSIPKTVIENLLIDHGDLAASDYDIPTFLETHNLWHQFLDIDLEEAVQLILDHFGYFPFVNVDGKFEPRQIDFTGSVDHTYTGTEIIEYSPNSKYATFINRVIVTGMSNVFTEVLYEEESIQSVNGTVGHWGGDKDLTVYYSKDRQRTCRDPRLEIVMSVSEFQVWGIKGGGSEQITSVDPDEHYLIITIEIPDLTGILIATIAALIALGAACIPCDSLISGWCGACIFAATVLLNLLLLILGSIASYRYNIWARPIGHERMTFQATANDVDFQQQLNGKIITETIDDPFCYTISSCQNVANFELSVVMAQRRRLKFRKTTHLMDEVGDILRINHPYSSELIDTYITKLKRTIKFGKKAAMIDDIEGWRLT